MKDLKRQTDRLPILMDPKDPDAVLVVTDDSVPGAIPVIPTSVAHSCWAYLAWTGGATSQPSGFPSA